MPQQRTTKADVLAFLAEAGYTPDTLPTLRSIQARTGGSLETISRAVREFNGTDSSEKSIELPAAAKQSAERFAQELWTSMLQHLDAGVTEECRQHQAQIEAANTTIKELEYEIDRLRTELAAANERADAFQAQAHQADIEKTAAVSTLEAFKSAYGV